MTKTICDIYGNDTPTPSMTKNHISYLKFCIECREAFNRRMVIRKSEAIKEVGK